MAGRAATPERVALESSFGASADPGLRRPDLATLVAGAGGADGWDDARLERLWAYRADRADLVASAAQCTLPPGDPTCGSSPLARRTGPRITYQSIALTPRRGAGWRTGRTMVGRAASPGGRRRVVLARHPAWGVAPIADRRVCYSPSDDMW